MPYEAIESNNNFCQAATAAAERRVSTTRENPSYTAVRPRERQHRETLRDSHGLPGPPACKASIGSIAAAATATFPTPHPTQTNCLRQEDHQRQQQRHRRSHESAMMLEIRSGVGSGLRPHSATQGERESTLLGRTRWMIHPVQPLLLLFSFFGVRQNLQTQHFSRSAPMAFLRVVFRRAHDTNRLSLEYPPYTVTLCVQRPALSYSEKTQWRA